MRHHLLLLAAAAVLLLASCDNRHHEADEAAARVLAQKTPVPADLPFELPAGSEVDDSRMRVQLASEAFIAVKERKETPTPTARNYYYVTDLSPEGVVAFYVENYGLDAAKSKVQSSEEPCPAPKLNELSQLSQVKDPHAPPSGPCKLAMLKLPNGVITVRRPVPDLLTGKWVDRTQLRVMFKVKQ